MATGNDLSKKRSKSTSKRGLHSGQLNKGYLWNSRREISCTDLEIYGLCIACTCTEDPIFKLAHMYILHNVENLRLLFVNCNMQAFPAGKCQWQFWSKHAIISFAKNVPNYFWNWKNIFLINLELLIGGFFIFHIAYWRNCELFKILTPVYFVLFVNS